MKRHSLAAIAAVLGLACAAHSALAAPAPCKLGLIADLDVRIGEGGAVAVPANLAGHDVWFVLATNNPSPSIYESALAGLGLAPKAIVDRNTTGSRTRRPETGLFSGDKTLDQMVSLQPLQLGKVSVGAWQAVVLPGADRPLAYLEGKPIVGVLGTQLFKLVDVELDLANHRVRLFKPNECAEAPVYWDAEFTTAKLQLDERGGMRFIMQLDGQNIDTGLLNGMRAASLDESIAKTYFGFDRHSPGILHDEPSLPGASYYAMTLTAAGLAMHNSRVRIVDALGEKCGASRSGGKEGSIQYAKCHNAPFSMGSALIEKLRIYVAGTQEKIYITRATPAAADTGTTAP